MLYEKNGGPAFPLIDDQVLNSRHGCYQREVHAGMTLRDWFAGQAIIGLAANDMRSEEAHDFSVWATNAYALADAMIEAR